MKTRCCCSKRYLLVFSILLVSVGSIFMSVSLSSCSSPSVKNQLLLCADSLMETYPDSALSILESITYPQKMPRADRALYGLSLKPWGIALKFLFLHHENILFPND